MKLISPIKIGFRFKGRWDNHDTHMLAWSSKPGIAWHVSESDSDRQAFYKQYDRSRLVQIYIARWVMSILYWPYEKLESLKHKYYYGRLEYQYERGRAEGLKEGLLNRDAYFEMTPEELKAILDIDIEKRFEDQWYKKFMQKK